MRDEEWLERLWESHADKVASFALRRVGPDRVDDVVIATFTVAWQRREQRPYKPAAWLMGVARNVIYEMYRSDDRWHFAGANLVSEANAADDTAEVVARRDLVRRGLEALSAPLREVLLLSAWDDVSAQEGARILNCTTGVSSARLMGPPLRQWVGSNSWGDQSALG